MLAVLAELARHPTGITLDELATVLGSPKPTVHRALATLRRAGMASLASRGIYVLGDEFVRLALRNLAGRPDTVRLQPLLDALANRYGETVHYAVLEGADIVYRAKMDPPQGAIRLTSVVGGRNPAYSTAVGKALLAAGNPTESDLVTLFGRSTFEPATPNTVKGTAALAEELRATRERGYGVDDQENELGVNCVALVIYLDGSAEPTGAISLSAVAFRTPLAQLVASIPDIRATIVRHLGAGALGEPVTSLDFTI